MNPEARCVVAWLEVIELRQSYAASSAATMRPSLGRSHSGMDAANVRKMLRDTPLRMTFLHVLLVKSAGLAGFAAKQIIHGFAAPYDSRGTSLHQHFGGPWAAVVVGREHHAVGSGVQHR